MKKKSNAIDKKLQYLVVASCPNCNHQQRVAIQRGGIADTTLAKQVCGHCDCLGLRLVGACYGTHINPDDEQ